MPYGGNYSQLSLGPGLLESVYLEVLIYELKKAGLKCEKEIGISVQYENIKFDHGFRADLIVEDSVIVELKAVEKILADVYAFLCVLVCG